MAEAAAMKAVGWFLSRIISKLVNKACSYFGGGDSNKKLKNLETVILPKIEFLIDAAEMMGNMDRLEPWLKDLRAAVQEAEDLLDEHEYDLLEEEAKNQASRPPSSVGHLLAAPLIKDKKTPPSSSKQKHILR